MSEGDAFGLKRGDTAVVDGHGIYEFASLGVHGYGDRLALIHADGALELHDAAACQVVRERAS